MAKKRAKRPRPGRPAHQRCPCHSGKPYAICCYPFHKSQSLPETPELLMRSRYAAYALGHVSYIIDTTHPESPHREHALPQWTQSLREFSEGTKFVGLNVAHSTMDGDWGTVTFCATLSQLGEQFDMREHSEFERVEGRWLYLRALEPKP